MQDKMNIDTINKIEKRMGMIIIAVTLLGLASLGFVVWVIIKLMQHWNII
jgi:hypothetical protein